MNANVSPFTLARFEYEQEHLYFLQKRLFGRLELRKPIYLVGSRGTGKTTLLKALSWSERLSNTSLARQVKRSGCSYIGIYLKLPEIQLGLISRWAAAAGEDVHANVFAHYLDLVWLEELLRAVSELAVVGQVSVSASQERKCIESIFSQCESLFLDSDLRPQTLREFSSVLRRRREDIEMSASTGSPPVIAVERLRLISHVGDFGRKVAEHLGQLCGAAAAPDDAASHLIFKICMDEGECLSEFQQRVVNTMLRLSRTPLFFVVSFVSHPIDPTTTLISGLSLQQADRELVLLDDLTEKEFRQLVEGVASVRVQHVSGDSTARFDTTRTLGAIDINGLLLGILRESVSPSARALLADAENGEADATSRTKGTSSTRGSESTAPPIYQTYLMRKLNFSIAKTVADARWKRRKQYSAELRKRFVAAYLSICADIGVEPRYASADVVLQTSDNCVRDFLGQLDEIFQEADLPLRRFLEQQIDERVQDRAVKAASRKKYESLPLFGVNSPAETRALVDGLSKLTALLQSRSQSNRHLRSSERGLFVVEFGDPPQAAAQYLLQSLREAAEAGFLRLQGASINPLSFRVHTSLAPMYGFSYRGAYYETSLEWEALDRLRKTKEPPELDELVKELYHQLERIDPQNDLFLRRP
jgi:hypothetical protein